MGNDFLLELLNGNAGIASVALVILCILYLSHETLALGVREAWHWESLQSRRIRVACAIMILSLGSSIRSWEIVRWRMAGSLPDGLDHRAITTGAVVALIGFLWLIREISKPLFGNAPWLCVLGAMMLYTGWAIGIRQWN